MSKPVVIAVVDDEVKMCAALGRLLRSHGYEVALFDSGEALLNTPHLLDCVLLDLHMAGMSGWDVINAFLRRNTRPPIIVITARDEPGNEKHLLRLGVRGYLAKPVDEAALLEAIVLSLPDVPNRH